ncbi:ABC transporter permease [Pseudorhizobium endolithicum]|uniref:ABC transporter permease n=1 Tax=Pseudorhizobium endolithicum TaxID=1191678 RepID=A0ABN7JT02_9HYPH|nr:ABC transporter permease [Pseudorhizobium endolithicum]CAD7039868.1 ABC transporter permease [Pseudorhizobium endolithicum]
MRAGLRRPILAAGLLLTAGLVSLAVLSLFWTPRPPGQMQIAMRLKPPFEQGLLGTDQFGRDVASMLMSGAWNSLSTAMAAVALGASLGCALGLGAAVWRGWAQALVLRGCDIVFAVPPILSAMMLAAFLGPGRGTAIIAIATFMVPVFARLTLGGARQIWSRPYVEAAIGMGRPPWRITFLHVLPNIADQIIVQATIQLGLAILTEAGLSFLGLGMAPPAPTWGRMLADAQTFLGPAPWLAILPGLAILLSVLGFSLLGDGLRDLLDPRAS